MATRLDGAARQAALRSLRGWLEVPDADALHKTFHFSSFREAWGFLVQVALLCEQAGHYPEILNYIDRVEIRLMTQELDVSGAGALTEQDVELGRRIDALAPERDAARTPR
jgi:4a-hydroxytetrahydrobiopterin dehydratase